MECCSEKWIKKVYSSLVFRLEGLKKELFSKTGLAS